MTVATRLDSKGAARDSITRGHVFAVLPNRGGHARVHALCRKVE